MREQTTTNIELDPNEFIVLVREYGRPSWHVATMRKRQVSAIERMGSQPLGYGTHTIPRSMWTAGPRTADPAFAARRAHRAPSKHGVRETTVGGRR